MIGVRHGRNGSYARWLCKQECHYTRREGQRPCRFCCGFTANTRKHAQPATTNTN